MILSTHGEKVARVRELTEYGAHAVLECVGLEQAVETALAIARPGGAVGRVGVPEHDTTPTGLAFWKNATIGGGPAPVRAYVEELLPDVLEGRIEPGRVFDRTGLDRGRARRLPRHERPRSPEVPDPTVEREQEEDRCPRATPGRAPKG